MERPPIGSLLNKGSLLIYKVLKINLLFWLSNLWFFFNLIFVPFTAENYLFFLLSILLIFPSLRAIFLILKQKFHLKKYLEIYFKNFVQAILLGVANLSIMCGIGYNIMHTKLVLNMFSFNLGISTSIFRILSVICLLYVIVSSLLQMFIGKNYSPFAIFFSCYIYLLKRPMIPLIGIVYFGVFFLLIFLLPTSVLLTMSVGMCILITHTYFDKILEFF